MNGMTPKDWFGVLVRGSGLYLLIVAISQCIMALIEYETMPMRGERSNLLYGLIYLMLGIIALRWADAIVRFAYPKERMHPPIDDEPPADSRGSSSATQLSTDGST